MSIFRINKNDNYTTMSNYHFRDKSLSLKAKGLLSLMLSLPDDWDYSIAGLVAICKENETSIKSALSELKNEGYVDIKKCMPNNTESGRIEYIYDIYEMPRTVKENNIKQNTIKQDIEKQEVENLPLENLPLEILDIENQVQLNTNILNTNNKNNNINKKPKEPKHKYGEYGRVLLTETEYNKLERDFSNREELIKFLDEYIEMKGYKANSHYLCIRRWVDDAVKREKAKGNKNNYNYNDKPTNAFHSKNQNEFEDLDRFYM